MAVAPQIITDRDVMIELLVEYKNSPCLWDPTNESYNNKAVRLKYMNNLRHILQKIEPEASVDSTRRKIENMKTTYHRERKKVERSKLAGGPIRKPSLWYYSFLTFLGKICVGERKKSSSDQDDDEPKMKRSRNDFRRSISSKQKAIFFQKRQREREHLATHQPSPNTESSADAAGHAISTQLKELPKLQRCLAEKLISEILFYAKIDQLSMNTSINLNHDTFQLEAQVDQRLSVSQESRERLHSSPDSQDLKGIKFEKQNISVDEEYLESVPSSPCEDIQTVFIEEDSSDQEDS